MNEPELFSSLLKIASALAVTVGIMFLLVFLFKKAMQRGGGEGNADVVRILSSRYLGPKSSIMLVDVVGHLLVIGIANGTMSLLTEIMDPESIQQLHGLRSPKERSSSFSEYLKGYLKRSRFDS